MSFIRNILSLFSNKEKDKSSVCCLGCRHLFYWNDGSAGCDIEKEDICIPNGFYLREESVDEQHTIQNIRRVKVFVQRFE